MFGLLFKKKLTEKEIAESFALNILNLVDQTFEDVMTVIINDSNFERKPKVDLENYDAFLLTVIAGNLKYVSRNFRDYRDVRITKQINEIMAMELGVDVRMFQKVMADYHTFFKRINHPSKNTLYAMSKTVFAKYNLNEYQKEYFRKMNSPNPVLLKTIDGIMENFIWEWDKLEEEYKIIS